MTKSVPVLIFLGGTKFTASVLIGSEISPGAMPDILSGTFENPAEESTALIREHELASSEENRTMWFNGNADGYRFVMNEPAANRFEATSLKINPATGKTGLSS